MPNLKELKGRITGITKTRKITAAMKLVATAKLKRATDRANAAKPYKEQLTGALARVAASVGGDISHPLLSSRDEVKRVLVVCLTVDRGLCGAFNNGLTRKVLAWADEQKAAGVEVDILPYGRKAIAFLKGRKVSHLEGVPGHTKMDKMELVRDLSVRVLSAFDTDGYDVVYLASNLFINTLIQKPVIEQIVPISVPETEVAADATPTDYSFEPNPHELLSQLLPLFLRTQLLQAFLETEAGELASRMTAMANATTNADDIISTLTLQYNRARQAAITTEITEIVSGAEAL